MSSPTRTHAVTSTAVTSRPAHAAAREAMAAWQAEGRRNYYERDPHFQRVLKHHLGPARFDIAAPALRAFGGLCATTLDALARETNRTENLPVLRRFDGIGRRTEEVVFHPGYAELGAAVYATGVIAKYARIGNETEQLAYVWLYGHHGEAGHLCPLACTAGLVKIVQSEAPSSLRAALLPGLLRTDRNHPEHLHGAQFLTEVQGGSDVGANACVAVDAGDGTWRIHGEKWFCSVVDADLYLMTARPEGAGEGTGGLGAFVVPRQLPDGSVNAIHIRRLKDKLGTRSMASAELDFAGALAWPVVLDGGFKRVVEVVLNTSRLYNAVASSGMIRRVEIEAAAYAAHRTAFGRPIAEFPLVADILDRIRDESTAATTGTFALAALADSIAVLERNAGGVAGSEGNGGSDSGLEAQRATWRLVVNMNKYFTSSRATRTILDGIEVFGGNGAIEEFSVLPRLLRDSVVCEQWEGTHNVLCAQVLRDLQKYRLHDAFFATVAQMAQEGASGKNPEAISAVREFEARIDGDREAVAAVLEAHPKKAASAIRPLVDRLAATWQVAALLHLCKDGAPPAPAIYSR
jgi:alkylation response protein AidB-like acyl-CoA dehydrogenase